jgi:hypothetical protein
MVQLLGAYAVFNNSIIHSSNTLETNSSFCESVLPTKKPKGINIILQYKINRIDASLLNDDFNPAKEFLNDNIT